MASAERFSGYTATISYSSTTQNLTQLDSWSVAPNTRKASIIPSGLVDRAHIGIAGAAPVVTWSSRDFVSIFTNMSISTGLLLDSTSTFRYQERTDRGTFETGATQETVTLSDGFMHATSITADQTSDDGAIVQGECVALWDGSVQPLVWNTGVDYTAVTAPAFVSRYFLGPVYHNGAEIAGVTSISVDPGIRFEARAFSGDPFPRKGAIVAREPSMRFTVAKVDAASALTTVFGSAISTGLIFYLQKGVASGTRVAAASSVHVKITAAAGDWQLDEASVNQNEDGSVTFSAMPTTAIALVTNSTIP